MEATMDTPKMRGLAERILAAWSSRDAARVADCYTADAIYWDPNTRGPVRGRDAIRRYVGKMFELWDSTWRLRELYPVAGQHAAAVLWEAELTLAATGQRVAFQGMDLVVLDGEHVARNEVYYDRTAVLEALAAAG